MKNPEPIFAEAEGVHCILLENSQKRNSKPSLMEILVLIDNSRDK